MEIGLGNIEWKIRLKIQHLKTFLEKWTLSFEVLHFITLKKLENC